MGRLDETSLMRIAMDHPATGAAFQLVRNGYGGNAAATAKGVKADIFLKHKHADACVSLGGQLLY
jgi:hypothetical protein